MVPPQLLPHNFAGTCGHISAHTLMPLQPLTVSLAPAASVLPRRCYSKNSPQFCWHLRPQCSRNGATSITSPQFFWYLRPRQCSHVDATLIKSPQFRWHLRSQCKRVDATPIKSPQFCWYLRPRYSYVDHYCRWFTLARDPKNAKPDKPQVSGAWSPQDFYITSTDGSPQLVDGCCVCECARARAHMCVCARVCVHVRV